MARALQVFLNADMRNGHNGLAALAKKYDMNVSKLTPGEYIIFINGAKDKIKLYAASNVVAYLKLPTGRVLDLNAIRFIPQAFQASGKIDYDSALRTAVEEQLKKPVRDRAGPLQAYRSAKSAGVMS